MKDFFCVAELADPLLQFFSPLHHLVVLDKQPLKLLLISQHCVHQQLLNFIGCVKNQDMVDVHRHRVCHPLVHHLHTRPSSLVIMAQVGGDAVVCIARRFEVGVLMCQNLVIRKHTVGDLNHFLLLVAFSVFKNRLQ